MATTNYAFVTPTVGAALNTWGGNLNANTEKLDDLLGGDQPIVGIDINSGAIDGTPVGANAASTGAFTTVTASGGVTGALTGNVTGNVTGNADTSDSWSSSRAINLVGSITGTANIDGSADVTITTSGGLSSAQVVDIVYPVGCLYETTVSENPGTTFSGTTWEAFGTGQVTVAIDSAQTEFDTVEETGGFKTHTLTIDEIPSHSHSYTLENPAGSGSSGSENGDSSYSSPSTGVTGGDAAHNNLQPYIVVYRWKRTA